MSIWGRGKGEISCTGLGGIWSFRHPLGFLKHIPMDKCKYWYIEIYLSLAQEISRCEVSAGLKKKKSNNRMLSFRETDSKKGSEERSGGTLGL
jgi:hypothetical protein